MADFVAFLVFAYYAVIFARALDNRLKIKNQVNPYMLMGDEEEVER